MRRREFITLLGGAAVRAAPGSQSGTSRAWGVSLPVATEPWPLPGLLLLSAERRTLRWVAPEGPRLSISRLFVVTNASLTFRWSIPSGR
jgi:hypothetical protein